MFVRRCDSSIGTSFAAVKAAIGAPVGRDLVALGEGGGAVVTTAERVNRAGAGGGGEGGGRLAQARGGHQRRSGSGIGEGGGRGHAEEEQEVVVCEGFESFRMSDDDRRPA